MLAHRSGDAKGGVRIADAAFGEVTI